MTNAASIAERYAASFEELRYALRLFDHFVLQPVECPDRTVAEALVTNMREAGYQPHFLAPVGESWLSLAAELERLGALPGTDRLFVVYGDEVTSHGQRGLGLLNQLRDRLGQLLDAPLVWCGPARFLEGTWSAMPDFWSVRALVVRLVPARAGAPKARLSERLWFRADPRGSLGVQALLDLARSQGDATAIAALTLDLAEALAAEGNLGAAERLVDDTVGTTVEGARLQALLRVALGQTVTPGPELGVRASAAVAAANGDLAAADRLLTEALESGAQDASLRAQRGDVRAARGDLPGAEADWRAAAERFEAEGDGFALAVAEEALAEIAQASDRTWDASVHLQRAATILRDRGDSANEARIRALLGAQPSTSRQVADAPRLFTAARELASRHPRPEQIRRRLEQAGAERLQLDLTGSAALIWSRVLGQLARSGHRALLALFDECEQSPTKDLPKRAMLAWLQISGLRCGGTTARTRRRLLEDACARATEHGAPDAVFVLGDVTQDATPGQFAEGASWLCELADAVGVPPTSIFVVPGPRDLTVVPEVEPVLVRHRARPLYVDEVLREPDETHPDRTSVRARRLADRAALWQRLAAFAAFTLQDGSPAWGHPAPAEAHPFWAGAVGGVHVVGLNSALLSAPPNIAPGDSADTLALGMSQLEVLARLPPDAPVVVLSHHGPAQLADGMLLSGLLSTRPHVLLHTGEVPFLGCVANRALGELVVRTPASDDAPGVAWGALDRTGLTVWHRRWDPALGEWVPRESPERAHRSREDLPPPLDRWLTGGAALPTATARGGGAFDPSRIYVDVPVSPAESVMVGREGVLSRMRQALVAAQVGALGRALALVGFGGLGKTRLAFEYARHYQGEYPGGVYIFHADTDVEAQLIQLGERARWVSPRSDRASARMIVSHRIRKARDALLVFDNLDDLAKIRGYLPPASLGSHLLVTSRVEQPGFVSLAPALLDRDASRRLLVTESGRPPEGPEENAAVDGLAERLDGLPLALELAAAWMRRHADLRWVAYGERLRAEGLGARELRDRAFEYESATAHTNDLRRTLRVTESVFEEAPLLRRVLDLLAWSGPGPMSTSLLAAALEVTELELAPPIATGTALRILSADAEGAAIHRLVAEVRREEVSLDGVWASGILSRLGRWFEARREEFSELATFEANTPHLVAWEAHAGVLGEPVEAARLAWLQGIGPAARGLYREADGHFQRAWRGLVACDACGTVLGARVGGAIAGTLHELGRVREVESWRRAAFSTLGSVLGHEEPETAAAEAELGSTLTSLGRYAEAAVHLEHAVVCLQQSGDGGRLARACGERRFLSQCEGEYHAALEWATRALAAWPTSLATDPDLAGLVCGRASALSSLGRSAEAEVEARSADGKIVRAFGERHPARGASLHQVAITFLDRGEFERGRQLLTEAVGLVEASSPTSPSLVWLFSGLGRAERLLGHPGTARSWYERSVNLAESIYGQTHREYATNIGNLSLSLDDPKRKLDLLLRAAAIKVTLLESEHPSFATGLVNIGLVRCRLGDQRRGIEDIGRGVAMGERLLGAEHPETLQGLGHLGWAIHESGRPAKAIAPLTRARDGLARIWGPDHPETVAISGNLGAALFDVGRRGEGLQLLAEALTHSRRRNGLAAPNTVTLACSLASVLAQQHRVSDALKVLDQHLAAVAPHSAEHDMLKTLRDRIQPPVRLKPA